MENDRSRDLELKISEITEGLAGLRQDMAVIKNDVQEFKRCVDKVSDMDREVVKLQLRLENIENRSNRAIAWLSAVSVAVATALVKLFLHI